MSWRLDDKQLATVSPVVGWRSSQRLLRDHYVGLDGNDYSVYPSVIGGRIEIIADLHRVGVFLRRAARRRPRADLGQTPDRAQLRATSPPPERCDASDLRRYAHPPRLRSRPDLSDYDTLLGVDGGVA